VPAVNSKAIRIVPLGGFGEIGMNCMVVEAQGRLLVIDCGVMFPPPDRYGIDFIHPSFEYLISRRDDIEALVLTHGHEDHVAAVPYLLRELDVPVLGAAYTTGLVSERMAEFDHGRHLRISRMDPGGRVQLGPFAVESFPMPHSIIDNTGLFVQTPAGTLLHTGDFKLGLKGPDGGAAVLERLAALGRRGVDLMICDSTGAEEPEEAGDEGTVERAILDLARGAGGRVFVAIFSSNILRLGSIASAAQATGRKLILAGRSVLNHSRVAAMVGALRLPAGLVVEPEEAGGLAPEKQLIVLSGTQGEERSALGRVSLDTYKSLSARPGDLVILSSRFIPGNEIAISRMIDRLLKLGARVAHRGNHPGVHVSGHGSRDEIRRAVGAVAPRSFLAAHGTYRHMAAAARIASEAGVASPCVAHDRQAAIGEIDVIAKGVVAEEALPWLVDQVRDHVRGIMRELAPRTPADSRQCAETARISLRRFLSKSISREPFVLVSVYPAGPGGEN